MIRDRDEFDPWADSGYLIPGTLTLKNKLGIEDRRILSMWERDLASARQLQSMASPVPGRFDLDHLKAIHRHLFQDVYEWAGKVRTVGLSKGDSVFARPEHIEREAAALFGELKKERYLRELGRPKFVDRAAHYFGEINALHPFREGNGRAQRAFMDQVALHGGRAFYWSGIQQSEMIDACVRDMYGDSARLAALLDRALLERLPEGVRAGALADLARRAPDQHAALMELRGALAASTSAAAGERERGRAVDAFTDRLLFYQEGGMSIADFKRVLARGAEDGLER